LCCHYDTAIAKVHLVHLMNAAQAPDGHPLLYQVDKLEQQICSNRSLYGRYMVLRRHLLLHGPKADTSFTVLQKLVA